MGIHVLIENVFFFLHMFVYGMPGTFSRGDMNWAATGRSQMMMKQKNMSLRLGRVRAASACVFTGAWFEVLADEAGDLQALSSQYVLSFSPENLFDLC